MRLQTTITRCLSVLLVAWGGSASALAACEKQLSVAASDYGPYMNMDKQGNWRGLDVDILQAVFKEAGCTYQFSFQVAPKHMVQMVSTGKIDIMLATTDTEERRRSNYFGPAYRDESIALIGLHDRVTALHDLKDFNDIKQRAVRLLIPNAGWYGNEYEAALPALRSAGLAIPFTYFDQGIRMLAAGRAQLIVGDPVALFSAARAQHVAVEALPFVVYKTPVHMMFSRASVSEHDLKLISEATVRLEKKGVLQSLRAAYGLP